MNYDKIKVLKGLEGIQTRPGMYVGDVSNLEALTNCLWEVIANSFDEHVAGFGSVVKLFILENERGSVYTITDYGRGIPNSWNEQEGKLNLELVFTHIHSGGKFEHDSYSQSSGLHGVGLTAVNALSSYLICTSVRPERIVTLTFVNGKLVRQRITENDHNLASGTRIIFKPNKKYLTIGKLNKKLIVRKLFGLTYVKNTLKINFRYRTNNGNVRSFWIGSKNGLLDLFRWRVGSHQPVVTPDMRLRYKDDEMEAELIFNWFKTNRNHVSAYTNGTEQTLGGSHVNQFIQELKNLFNRSKVSLSNQEIKEGLHAAISIMITEPQYSSQTKEKLSSAQGREVIKKCFQHNYAYFVAAANQIKKLTHHLKFLSKKKQEYLSSIQSSTDGKGTLSLSYTGKLLDCISKDTEINEIMICEGDSAGATAKSARDKYFQAIMPIRGKILNVQRTTLRRVFNSETIRNLITAIGTRFGKDYDYSHLRYGKIILMTDADEDGKQIQALLIALFYKYLPDLIKNNHLKIALAPLFKLDDNKRKFFFFSRIDLERYLLSKNGFSQKFSNLFYESRFNKMLDKLEKLEFVLRTLESNDSRGESFSSKFQNRFKEPCRIVLRDSFCLLTIGYRSMKSHLLFRKNELEQMRKLMILDPREDLFTLVREVLDLNKKSIRRYKGLGQMDFDELWDLIMNPENRKLVNVNFNDGEAALRKFDLIMGNKPWYRKWLIGQDDQLDLHDLDV